MPNEHLIIRRPTTERIFVYVLVSLVFLVLFGAGGVVGLLIAVARPYFSKRALYAMTLVGILWTVVLYLTRSFDDSLQYWLFYALPLGGIAYLVISALLWLNHWYLHFPTWDRSISAQEARIEQHQERTLSKRFASHQMTYHDDIEIGLIVHDDVRSRNVEGLRFHNHRLWAEEQLLNQHLLLIGAPGSGKSEAIKKIIAEVLAKTQRDVFVVDGKGEEDFATSVQQLFREHRGKDIPLFTMGTAHHGHAYNGFVGSDEAIKQRLTAMFNIEQQSGDGEFYANVNRALLHLICLSPEGAPRSLSELDERLSLSWLKYCYRMNPRKVRAIARYEPWFDGLRVRADSLIWDFAEYLSPEGFSLDNTSGAVFSLRTAAMGDTSRRFLNFLIEDFKDWVGKRQQRPGLLVIDEFGQFENQSIIALIELARSANLGILLATQDLSAVRERHVRERLLSSIQTKILMKTDTPEIIGELAGTYTTSHLTYQTDEVDLTGLGSLRLEEERKVNLNAVRRFPAGRAYVIRCGVGVIVQVRQIANRSSIPN